MENQMKKYALSLLAVIVICYVIDTSQPNGNQTAQFVGGLSLCGMIAFIIFGAIYMIATSHDEATINKQYHDRLPPAPLFSKDTIRPREGGPIPDYVPKWQRPGYDPNKE